MPDPYTSGMVLKDPFFKKQVIEGRIVAVLSIQYEKRGMLLIPQASRVVLQNDIHELMLTDEAVDPGGTVDRICCVAFFEVTSPGVIVKGDALSVAGRFIGTVLGFNDDHMPNHLNILAHGHAPKTGKELGVDLAEPVRLEKRGD